MKQLYEYLKVSDIKKNVNIVEGFPKEYDKDIICSFLDNEGFFKAPSKLVNKQELTMKEIFDYFDIPNKAYMVKDVADGSFWFRIFKGGAITNKNPIYVMQIKINKGKNSPEYELYGIETKKDDNFDWEREYFIEEINKHFGWE